MLPPGARVLVRPDRCWPAVNGRLCSAHDDAVGAAVAWGHLEGALLGILRARR
jgi:hypothetical protein